MDSLQGTGPLLGLDGKGILRTWSSQVHCCVFVPELVLQVACGQDTRSCVGQQSTESMMARYPSESPQPPGALKVEQHASPSAYEYACVEGQSIWPVGTQW